MRGTSEPHRLGPRPALARRPWAGPSPPRLAAPAVSEKDALFSHAARTAHTLKLKPWVFLERKKENRSKRGTEEDRVPTGSRFLSGASVSFSVSERLLGLALKPPMVRCIGGGFFCGCRRLHGVHRIAVPFFAAVATLSCDDAHTPQPCSKGGRADPAAIAAAAAS